MVASLPARLHSGGRTAFGCTGKRKHLSTVEARYAPDFLGTRSFSGTSSSSDEEEESELLLSSSEPVSAIAPGAGLRRLASAPAILAPFCASGTSSELSDMVRKVLQRPALWEGVIARCSEGASWTQQPAPFELRNRREGCSLTVPFTYSLERLRLRPSRLACPQTPHGHCGDSWEKAAALGGRCRPAVCSSATAP